MAARLCIVGAERTPPAPEGADTLGEGHSLSAGRYAPELSWVFDW